MYLGNIVLSIYIIAVLLLHEAFDFISTYNAWTGIAPPQAENCIREIIQVKVLNIEIDESYLQKK